ncbi:hypothetical protein LINGRAHAP2_LOCUS6862 [Linum grandiflorum]
MALCLGVMIQTLDADVGANENVWQKRAEEAKKNTMDAYIPNVMEVTNTKNAGTSTVAIESAAGEVKLPSDGPPVTAVPEPTIKRR